MKATKIILIVLLALFIVVGGSIYIYESNKEFEITFNCEDGFSADYEKIDGDVLITIASSYEEVQFVRIEIYKDLRLIDSHDVFVSSSYEMKIEDFENDSYLIKIFTI